MQDLNDWLSACGGCGGRDTILAGIHGKALGPRDEDRASRHPSTLDGPHNHACILIRA